MMKCPKCNSNQQYVTDSRERFRGVVRTRRCERCGYVFKTVEKVIPVSLQDRNAMRVRKMAEQMNIKLMEE